MWSFALLDPVAETPLPETASLRGIVMDGCENCCGDHLVTALAPDGSHLDIPCPDCVPNDALGG
jgi:hypothetical protein